MIRVGRYELISVVNGTLRLDGGAMFGVVPKVLWQNVCEPDEQNRIPLASRTLIAIDREAGRVILVDTGCGTKWAPTDAERYAIQTDATAVDRALATVGLSRTDVSDVVVTHLHFDHNGGLTDWYDEPGGRTTLRYPRARHWIHRKHWDHAHQPTVRDRASFVPHDFRALASEGVLQFVEGDRPDQTIDGIEWFVSCGHTPYQLLPIFTAGGRSLMFIGDVVPTMAHLRIGWVMAYDLFPLTTVAEREVLYNRCLSEGMMLAFPHDPAHGGVEIDGTPERPVVTSTPDLGPA